MKFLQKNCMTLSQKYRFADFTLNNYKRLLNLAKQNYVFVLFGEIWKAKHKAIVLRHDVEFSIPIALRMAEIENSLGVKATYFVQLHSEFYNLLEKNTYISIKKIQSLGHQIGLHFDAHFWNVSDEDQLDEGISLDKKTLTDYLNIEPKCFSFHNTTPFILSCEKDKYAGLLNVYSKRIKEHIAYTADSTGFWRYEVLEERLREAKERKLQLLIHDGMWQDEVLPPRRRIHKVIDDQAAFLKKHYDEMLLKLGAKNIDWEKVFE